MEPAEGDPSLYKKGSKPVQAVWRERVALLFEFLGICYLLLFTLVHKARMHSFYSSLETTGISQQEITPLHGSCNLQLF